VLYVETLYVRKMGSRFGKANSVSALGFRHLMRSGRVSSINIGKLGGLWFRPEPNTVAIRVI
jgi:hypothetical protein